MRVHDRKTSGRLTFLFSHSPPPISSTPPPPIFLHSLPFSSTDWIKQNKNSIEKETQGNDLISPCTVLHQRHSRERTHGYLHKSIALFSLNHGQGFFRCHAHKRLAKWQKERKRERKRERERERNHKGQFLPFLIFHSNIPTVSGPRGVKGMCPFRFTPRLIMSTYIMQWSSRGGMINQPPRDAGGKKENHLHTSSPHHTSPVFLSPSLLPPSLLPPSLLFSFCQDKFPRAKRRFCRASLSFFCSFPVGQIFVTLHNVICGRRDTRRCSFSPAN